MAAAVRSITFWRASVSFGASWPIDWDRGRITVHSPKTEHHEGGATRQIPIFPELREPLESVYFAALETGELPEYVITRYRDRNANLRTQLERIIRRAGLKPWPKLFQNLRSTRETELTEKYPIQVVCEWIGNSAAVAMERLRPSQWRECGNGHEWRYCTFRAVSAQEQIGIGITAC